MGNSVKVNLFFVVTIIISYRFLAQEIASAIIVAMLTLKSIIKFRDGVFFWCSVSHFLYTISTTFFAISVGVILFGLIPKALSKIMPKVWCVLICVCFSMILSFSYGYESHMISLLLTLSNILIFICLLLTFHKERDYVSLVNSFWYGSIILAGCTLISIGSNGEIESERLSFEDNVRSLANGLIFPLFFKITDWMDNKNRCSLPNRLQSSLFILFLVLLILTLSKGAIFSLILVVFFYAMVKKKINFKFIFAVVVMLMGAIVAQSQGLINFSRFGERNYDLNGRTAIWSFYFDHLFCRGPIGFWFGFGPGNVKRIAPYEYLGKYYAHSTILDFFFSYGFIGFSLFLLFVIYLFKICINNHNHIGLALLILSLLTYSVTGASTNTQIFIVFYAALLSNVISLNTNTIKISYRRK